MEVLQLAAETSIHLDEDGLVVGIVLGLIAFGVLVVLGIPRTWAAVVAVAIALLLGFEVT